MKLHKRIISICLSALTLLSVAPFQAKAAEATASLIEVTVTETTEAGVTINIKNNKDYGTNQIGFYKVLKTSEPTFAAQTEATKTVSDLEAGTGYVVYAAIGDYYAMAVSNDYSSGLCRNDYRSGNWIWI